MGVVHQEDRTLINTYALNAGAPKYVREILEDFKKDVNNNTVIIGNFNTPLSKMGKSSKQESTRILWHSTTLYIKWT